MGVLMGKGTVGREAVGDSTQGRTWLLCNITQFSAQGHSSCSDTGVRSPPPFSQEIIHLKNIPNRCDKKRSHHRYGDTFALSSSGGCGPRAAAEGLPGDLGSVLASRKIPLSPHWGLRSSSSPQPWGWSRKRLLRGRLGPALSRKIQVLRPWGSKDTEPQPKLGGRPQTHWQLSGLGPQPWAGTAGKAKSLVIGAPDHEGHLLPTPPPQISGS